MQSEKEQVALTSIAASAALAIAKAIVGVSTGSLAILSEAGHRTQQRVSACARLQ